ncbi:MAG: gluconate 2-dehydrogenase subunit 3 family protein [Sphingomonadales bacterium]|nr:gluconate 2-dehydrogenase subunit 3 family protein [Sphingomonadales bacterium]
MNGLDRRSLLEGIAVLVGAAALPASALAAPRKGRRLLDARTTALLAAVADTIIPRTDTPGAVDVGVPARFDALLRDWASPPSRTALTGALAAIDAAAGARGFAALSPTARHDLLSAHDRAQARDPGYGRLKGLIVQLYYYSEPGCTQELRYEHAPGAWVPSMPITPETRAWGGAALM